MIFELDLDLLQPTFSSEYSTLIHTFMLFKLKETNIILWNEDYSTQNYPYNKV